MLISDGAIKRLVVPIPRRGGRTSGEARAGIAENGRRRRSIAGAQSIMTNVAPVDWWSVSHFS